MNLTTANKSGEHHLDCRRCCLVEPRTGLFIANAMHMSCVSLSLQEPSFGIEPQFSLLFFLSMYNLSVLFLCRWCLTPLGTPPWTFKLKTGRTAWGRHVTWKCTA
jgi:hypothetical protein